MNNITVAYDFISEELEDIKKCVENLYATRAGSQPQDREFGIDYDGIVGMPIEVAKNQMALEITDKTERYEPRVIVGSVDFEADAVSGLLIPIVHLKGEAG